MATQDYGNQIADNGGDPVFNAHYNFVVNSSTSITGYGEGGAIIQLKGSNFSDLYTEMYSGTVTEIYVTGENYNRYNSHYYNFEISFNDFMNGRIIGYDADNRPITLDYWNGATVTDFDLLKYGDDLINGSTGKDELRGSFGNDHLFGNDGNDVAMGGPGDDVIDGGGGDDDLSGGFGTDTVNGGAGDDTLYGNDFEMGSASYVFHPDTNFLNGDAGDDVIYAQSTPEGDGGILKLSELTGGVVADGGSGTDRIIVNFNYISDDMKLDWSDPSIKNVLPDGSSTQNIESYEIILGSGNDEVHDGSLDDTIDTGAGEDVVYYGGGRHDVSLGSGDDLFVVSGEHIAEFLNTYGGVDPGDGFDLFVCDGSTLTDGFDISGSGLFESCVILGGAGYNGIDGSDGADFLDGGAGADFLYGSAGDDTYFVDNIRDSVIERAGSGADTICASSDFTLDADSEIEFLRAGADSKGVIAQWVTGGAYQPDPIKTGLRLTGNALAQTVSGGDGGDTLDGGGGADILIGGLGNDTYVTDGGDRIVEAVKGGTDTVRSSVTYALGDNVESLTLTGTAAIGGTGNALANTLTGNAAANLLDGGNGGDTLDGGGGADTLVGGLGDDTYVTDGGDSIVEFTMGGTDTIRSSVTFALWNDIENLTLTGTAAIGGTGSDLANTLTGNAAANLLNGGGGADTLIGGLGDDTYVTDEGDRIVEAVGGGTDTVQSSVTFALGDNVENLTLTGTAAIGGTGNALANTLTGNAAANLLDGGAGADTLIGGLGNDTYRVDSAADRVVEAMGGGKDTVLTRVGYALAAGQEIETLRVADVSDTASLKLTGNAFGQTLLGNAGANLLDGGGGADALYGGAGNDVYVVDNARDRVFEAAGQGKDTLLASVSYVLATGQEVDTLQFVSATGSAALNLQGNAFAQALLGNRGANMLDGGLGNDTLTGKGGADTFVFSTKPGAGNLDHVTDFAPEDTIRLAKSVFTALSAGVFSEKAFKLLDEGKLDADDRILYKQATGELFYDADGSGKGAAVKFAVLDNHAALTHADILVV